MDCLAGTPRTPRGRLIFEHADVAHVDETWFSDENYAVHDVSVPSGRKVETKRTASDGSAELANFQSFNNSASQRPPTSTEKRN